MSFPRPLVNRRPVRQKPKKYRGVKVTLVPTDPSGVVVIPRPWEWRGWLESFDYKYHNLDREHPHTIEELIEAFRGKRIVPAVCRHCLDHYLVALAFSRDCRECGSKGSVVTVFELEMYS